MRAQGIPESLARVEFAVQFSHGAKGRRRAREAPGRPDPTHAAGLAAAPTKAASAGSVPKITRLLVLGHHFERLVREGAVKDYAEIARLTGITRARVTQIVNLTLLAPDIQEKILVREPASERLLAFERNLRQVTIKSAWSDQRRLYMVAGANLDAQIAGSSRRHRPGRPRGLAKDFPRSM